MNQDAAVVFLTLLLLSTVSCQPPAAPTTATSAVTKAQIAARSDQPVTRREYWDVIYFENTKVGFAHTVYDSVNQHGQSLVQISADSELAIRRFGQTVRQRLTYRSIETPTGEVIRFDSDMTGDGGGAGISMATKGIANGEWIDLQITTLGKTQTAKIPWNKSWGGFFATEQTLERKPLQPGERRTIHALTPGFNQTAIVEFVAVDMEATDMLAGKRDLLRVRTTMKLGENTLEQIIWTDRAGQTMKTYMPALKQTSYRASRDLAMAKNSGSFDLGERSIVKVERQFDQPHSLRRVVYRARLESGSANKAFVSSATQLSRTIDAQTVEVVVRALRASDELGSEFPADLEPTDDDLQSNNLIQSDDAEIVRLSQVAAGDKSDALEIAVALEQFVRRSITNKNFSQALASAAEVARSREGDCTEHAVLLAALCRARKLPARVAIGLVYFQPSRGFAFHMWTEVWLKDRWLPLDATLGLGGIGAAHLKVSHSNLKGVDPLSQFLPVLNLIGNLKLDVVSAE